MSADERGSTGNTVATRLRRRRTRAGRQEETDRQPAETPMDPQEVCDERPAERGDEVYKPDAFDFGYGGWTITLDSLEMPPTEDAGVAARTGSPSLRSRLRRRPAEPRSGERQDANPDDDEGERLDRAPGSREPQEPVARSPADRASGDVDPFGERRRARAYERGAGRGAGRQRRDPPAAGSAEDRPIIAPPQRNRIDPATGAGTKSAARRPVPVPRESPSRSEGSRGVRHRAHQRIEGGGTVMIEDRLFPLADWSAGGISIPTEGHPYRIGERRKLELEIDLDEYAVNLDLEGEVANRSPERTGWRFVDPTETQRQVLRALTEASLGGRAFAAPLQGLERSSGRETSSIAGSRRDVARRFGPLAALLSLPFNAAIIALLAGLAIFGLSDGEPPAGPVAGPQPAPVVRAEHAAVAVERIPLTAPDSGIAVTWDKAPGESVSEGAPLVTIVNEAEGGIRTVATSPCECVLARRLVDTGDRVDEGREVALLYPQGSEGHIQALFPRGRAPEPGAAASVRLPYSGESFRGVVESVGAFEDPDAFIGLPGPVLADRNGSVFARITTSPAVPAALAGDPAIVTIAPDA